ncbi:MAG: hypothetical protein BAA03_03865 [Caldibacillus debilis]|nr:MAG: hypothetical protein BAA03_03865 [Caldibacillus debilis]
MPQVTMEGQAAPFGGDSQDERFCGPFPGFLKDEPPAGYGGIPEKKKLQPGKVRVFPGKFGA